MSDVVVDEGAVVGRSRAVSVAGLVVSWLLTLAASLGGLVSVRSIREDYRRLALPSWAPPGAVFGPVWTVLYAMMAISAWRIWSRSPSLVAVGEPLAVYGTQLALNASWTPLFFRFKRRGAALVDIAALWVALVRTIVVFARRDKTAALMLVPYLSWVTFAAALNYNLWKNNRNS